MANGYILYEGPSRLDGKPIVVIATGFSRGSRNRKTGSMIQTYILRSDMEPQAAVKTGDDTSICGDCKHRGDGTGKGRTCYVNVGQGPLAVYRAYKLGSYPLVKVYAGMYFASLENGTTCLAMHRIVRLGSYGDPAAVPACIWQTLLPYSKGHTGYTHQWRTTPELRSIVMASCDSIQEAQEAQAAGWRTFRVAMPGDNYAGLGTKLKGESRCPASAEAGKKLTCAQCRACSGVDGMRGHIVIQAHGGKAVMSNIRRVSCLT